MSRRREAKREAGETLSDTARDEAQSRDRVRRSLNILLDLTFLFRGDQPDLAGTLLYLAGYGAALAEDVSLSAEYLERVAQVLVHVPQVVRETFHKHVKDRAEASERAATIGLRISMGLTCSVFMTFSPEEQVVVCRMFLDEHMKPVQALSKDRKREWVSIAEALTEDATARGGDDDDLTALLAHLRSSCEAAADTFQSHLVDVIGRAFFVIGRVTAGGRLTIAFLELVTDLAKFLNGLPVLRESTYFSNMNGVMRSFRPESEDEASGGGKHGTPVHVM